MTTRLEKVGLIVAILGLFSLGSLQRWLEPIELQTYDGQVVHAWFKPWVEQPEFLRARRLVEQLGAESPEAWPPWDTLTPAEQQQFLTTHEDLVKVVTTKYRWLKLPSGRKVEEEDLRQEGRLALMEAYRAFRGGSFPAFARVVIECRLIDSLRSAGRLDHGNLSLDSDVLGETISDEEAVDPSERSRWLVLLRDATAKIHLTPEEQTVLELRYGQGMSNQEIADRLGWYKVKIFRRHDSALAKLRAALGVTQPPKRKSVFHREWVISVLQKSARPLTPSEILNELPAELRAGVQLSSLEAQLNKLTRQHEIVRLRRKTSRQEALYSAPGRSSLERIDHATDPSPLVEEMLASAVLATAL